MAAVITGAKAYLKLSGDVLAFCSGVSVSHDNNLKEIPQLDDLEVAEYAEIGHRCAITVNSIKLASNAQFGGQKVTNSAASFGMDHPNGELKQILLQPEIIIEVVESVGVYDSNGNLVDLQESPIYIGYGSKFAGGSGQVDARGIWQGTWNFKCKRGVGI